MWLIKGIIDHTWLMKWQVLKLCQEIRFYEH